MSTTDQQQRETEQVVGVLAGIVQKKPDTWQAAVTPDGSEYTKNLWTKDADLVAMISSQLGNRLAFLCNVSRYTHQATGQPATSLWIDVVGAPPLPGAPAQPVPPQFQGAPAPQLPTIQVQPTVIQPDEREQKIHRQTASKVAAILLGYLSPEEQNMTVLLSLSERLCRYYETGATQTVETLDDLMARAMPAGMDDVPRPSEDIPF